jgi:hypothetical protein
MAVMGAPPGLQQLNVACCLQLGHHYRCHWLLAIVDSLPLQRCPVAEMAATFGLYQHL